MMSKKGMEPTLLEALSMYFSRRGESRLRAWREGGVLNVGDNRTAKWPPSGRQAQVIRWSMATGRSLWTEFSGLDKVSRRKRKVKVWKEIRSYSAQPDFNSNLFS